MYYIRHNYSFEGWTKFSCAAREAELIGDPRSVIVAAGKGEQGAYLLEAVADALATRAEDYLDGLSPELAQGFDPPGKRGNYLRMQENICDLRLNERRRLGQKLWQAIHGLRPDTPEDMTYAVGYVDYKPDFLYVLAAARGLDRATLLKRGVYSLRAGLAYFSRGEGMYIADRDGEGFEVVYLGGLKPTEEYRTAGERLFGHLKLS